VSYFLTNSGNKTQTLNRNRFIYSLLLISTIGVGLASRQFPGVLPHWIHLYLGDTLWALMVFLLIGLFFNNKSTFWVALTALAFSYSIEISQLYHANWIDALRANPLGGLILGFGFLWSDIVCYTIGIGFGYIMEKLFLNGRIYSRK
jgi:hypothetical protein